MIINIKKCIISLLLVLSTYNYLQAQPKILVGACIRQSHEVLKEFLTSLQELQNDALEVNYFFIDDNTEQDSTNLLYAFMQETPARVKVQYARSNDSYYHCSEVTHHWSEDLVWKVARLKNNIINYALEQQYDYLFLIDSDILLHPDTLHHLVSLKKDIVSEVFWTRWQPDYPELPQVWLYDTYTMYEHAINEPLTQEEIVTRQNEFISKLRIPGVYPVGGLGACTLISRNALKKGVNFSRISNITFWGEDRHFCVRAAAYDLGLWVDTHYPAYHIYRKSLLEGVAQFKQNNKNY